MIEASGGGLGFPPLPFEQRRRRGLRRGQLVGRFEQPERGADLLQRVRGGDVLGEGARLGAGVEHGGNGPPGEGRVRGERGVAVRPGAGQRPQLPQPVQRAAVPEVDLKGRGVQRRAEPFGVGGVARVIQRGPRLGLAGDGVGGLAGAVVQFAGAVLQVPPGVRQGAGDGPVQRVRAAPPFEFVPHLPGGPEQSVGVVGRPGQLRPPLGGPFGDVVGLAAGLIGQPVAVRGDERLHVLQPPGDHGFLTGQTVRRLRRAVDDGGLMFADRSQVRGEGGEERVHRQPAVRPLGLHGVLRGLLEGGPHVVPRVAGERTVGELRQPGRGGGGAVPERHRDQPPDRVQVRRVRPRRLARENRRHRPERGPRGLPQGGDRLPQRVDLPGVEGRLRLLPQRGQAFGIGGEVADEGQPGLRGGVPVRVEVPPGHDEPQRRALSRLALPVRDDHPGRHLVPGFQIEGEQVPVPRRGDRPAAVPGRLEDERQPGHLPPVDGHRLFQRVQRQVVGGGGGQRQGGVRGDQRGRVAGAGRRVHPRGPRRGIGQRPQFVPRGERVVEPGVRRDQSHPVGAGFVKREARRPPVASRFQRDRPRFAAGRFDEQLRRPHRLVHGERQRDDGAGHRGEVAGRFGHRVVRQAGVRGKHEPFGEGRDGRAGAGVEAVPAGQPVAGPDPVGDPAGRQREVHRERVVAARPVRPGDAGPHRQFFGVPGGGVEGGDLQHGRFDGVAGGADDDGDRLPGRQGAARRARFQDFDGHAADAGEVRPRQRGPRGEQPDPLPAQPEGPGGQGDDEGRGRQPAPDQRGRQQFADADGPHPVGRVGLHPGAERGGIGDRRGVVRGEVHGPAEPVPHGRFGGFNPVRQLAGPAGQSQPARARRQPGQRREPVRRPAQQPPHVVRQRPVPIRQRDRQQGDDDGRDPHRQPAGQQQAGPAAAEPGQLAADGGVQSGGGGHRGAGEKGAGRIGRG